MEFHMCIGFRIFSMDEFHMCIGFRIFSMDKFHMCNNSENSRF